MIFPIVKLPFAARLIPDDLELLNEAIPKILPDTDLEDDKAITGRAVLIGAVEAALSKVSKKNTSLPADTEKIKELEEKVQELEKQLATALGNIDKASLTIIEKDELLQEKEGIVQSGDLHIEELKEELQAVRGSASDLEKYVPGENEMRIDLDPLTKALLIRYSKKVSKKQNKEVKPGIILTSLLNRYLTMKEVEFPGFPHLISDRELKAISENVKKAINEPVE